ncbi:Glutamate 5-kinase [Caloramator mitchellensis]|uniref:Glutamate 5-kinase n=1 Tax=Caloramator mitchellensis TaxID=908809 RepID=A0A0R3K371_CALMK|nr:Glutamate 5-kinase [Caloramator mitchellensis]
MNRSEYFKDKKRVVIKIGSSTLTHSNGLPNYDMMEKLIRQIADLKNAGYEIIIVTSGAIGAGMAKLKLKQRPKTIPEKQACAAVGQGLLMHIYEKIFSEYGIIVGQILLTREDINNRIRFLNARNSIFSLLKNGIVPIINENDAVAVDEIKIGDNDTLSALVSILVEGDLLIILSDIEGLYNKNPLIYPDAELISTVESIDESIINIAGGAGSKLGTGGMATKIEAAKIALSSGISMIIAKGSNDRVLYRILKGENIGTIFLSSEEKLNLRKRWIAFGSKIKGKIIIDDGAVKALVNQNKSLLKTGIKTIEGNFSSGDSVAVLDLEGNEIAKGLVNFSALELLEIINSDKKNNQNYKEVIHRDNMVIL